MIQIIPDGYIIKQEHKNSQEVVMENNKRIPIRIITVTAVFTAMNIVMSSFSVPVPGGHLYLNDVVIAVASMLLGPLPAFVVGGVGAFLGDLFFYPAPMFVSLVTHGLQAVAISIISHKFRKENLLLGSDEDPIFWKSILAVFVGAVIMVVGYSFGRAYIYGNPEQALLKLPYQILQAFVGGFLGIILVFVVDLKGIYRKIFKF